MKPSVTPKFPSPIHSLQLGNAKNQRKRIGRRTHEAGVPNERRKRPSRILILPGFLSGSQPYYEMAENLKSEGFQADVLEVTKSEWYPTLIGATFEWYVLRLAARIDQLYSKHGPITLVAHSAGGWLARICLGSTPYMGFECNRWSKVQKLITLGTPHLSLEQYPFGKFQENVISTADTSTTTQRWKSSLQFANELYGNASNLAPVQIITIVGSGFIGKKMKFGERLKYWLTQGGLPRNVSMADFAWTSYKANCGSGCVDGDGVCPIETSLLPGAAHEVLSDVYHGPNDYGLPWYGSSQGIAAWRSYLTD